mmetsp:Transcript_33433/g.79278  ORF Transcript_33433/g.79278 Transcript_33433/m.79278 type:complete len:227 (-) Transcript_33433:402-1082(-)
MGGARRPSQLQDPLGYVEVDDEPGGVHDGRHEGGARHRRVVPEPRREDRQRSSKHVGPQRHDRQRDSDCQSDRRGDAAPHERESEYAQPEEGSHYHPGGALLRHDHEEVLHADLPERESPDHRGHRLRSRVAAVSDEQRHEVRELNLLLEDLLKRLDHHSREHEPAEEEDQPPQTGSDALQDALMPVVISCLTIFKSSRVLVPFNFELHIFCALSRMFCRAPMLPQ